MIKLENLQYFGHDNSFYGGYKPRELYLTDLKDICEVKLKDEPDEEGFTRDRYHGALIHHGDEITGVFTIFHSGNGRIEVLQDCPEDLRREIEQHQRKRWLPLSLRTLARYIYLTSAFPLGLYANFLLLRGMRKDFLIVFAVMLGIRRMYTEARNRIF